MQGGSCLATEDASSEEHARYSGERVRGAYYSRSTSGISAGTRAEAGVAAAVGATNRQERQGSILVKSTARDGTAGV